MAAIAGLIMTRGAVPDPRRVHEMLLRMRHRAPDGLRLGVLGDAVLGFGALHATPESCSENQPVAVGGRLTVVVDGRIDNRDELIATMRIDRVDAARMGDGHLMALCFERWGESLWEHVVGDYALAAWHHAERRLTLLRDRIGVRPLYYAGSGDFLAFASEPEALLGLPGVSRTCDPATLAYLLDPQFSNEDPGATLYRDVRRLRPGQVLTTHPEGRIEVRAYWSMQPQPLLRLGSADEYIAAFEDVFSKAVACRLRTRSRPALMLSGGIDSACVLAADRALASYAKPPSLIPVSVVAQAVAEDGESSNILRMHAHGAGVALPADRLAELGHLQELIEAAWSLAHPIDNSILLPRLVYLAAARQGSQVVLDGIDGDLVMMTESRHAARMAMAGRLLAAWAEARDASRTHTYLQGLPPARIILSGLLRDCEPTWFAAVRYRLRYWRQGDAHAASWLTPERAVRMQLGRRVMRAKLADRRRRAGGSDPENLIHAWFTPGFARSLEGFDRAAGCFGLEAWHPWCDLRVLEFFLSLPSEWKERGGWNKWVARSAFSSQLPHAVAWHSGKDHLGSLVHRQVVEASGRRAAELVDETARRLEGWIDRDVLLRCRESLRFVESGDRSEDPYDYTRVMTVATLGAWMKRYDLEV